MQKPNPLLSPHLDFSNMFPLSSHPIPLVPCFENTSRTRTSPWTSECWACFTSPHHSCPSISNPLSHILVLGKTFQSPLLLPWPYSTFTPKRSGIVRHKLNNVYWDQNWNHASHILQIHLSKKGQQNVWGIIHFPFSNIHWTSFSCQKTILCVMLSEIVATLQKI